MNSVNCTAGFVVLVVIPSPGVAAFLPVLDELYDGGAQGVVAGVEVGGAACQVPARVRAAHLAVEVAAAVAAGDDDRRCQHVAQRLQEQLAQVTQRVHRRL